MRIHIRAFCEKECDDLGLSSPNCCRESGAAACRFNLRDMPFREEHLH